MASEESKDEGKKAGKCENSMGREDEMRKTRT